MRKSKPVEFERPPTRAVFYRGLTVGKPVDVFERNASNIHTQARRGGVRVKTKTKDALIRPDGTILIEVTRTA
jgi:hypothetical protein